MEGDTGLSFALAKRKLQARPWLCDHYDAWLRRLGDGRPYRCVCVFVDNSGVDIVLGIFVLARELLKLGTKVILCANSRPALNDVTKIELELLTNRLCRICPLLANALQGGRLFIMENGQASPCLDLSRIDECLAALMSREKVDLLILEGMGRALHTNFEARFLCDSLKIAVIKNEWLANRLGGELFSVIFKYEVISPDEAGATNGHFEPG